MLDIGLFGSGVVIWVVLTLAARWAPLPDDGARPVVDRLMMPALAGLLVGRLVAILLDDRNSLRSIPAILVVRSGVEFWAGVVALIALLIWSGRRQDPWRSLAELAPFLLWGYAAYEAGCVVRDACYGPASPVGLAPSGLRTRMFPVAFVVAATVAGLGVMVHLWWSLSPKAKVLVAVGGVGGVRAAASVWLPHIGSGLTRQHLESLGVTALTALVGVVWGAVAWQRKRVLLKRHGDRAWLGIGIEEP